MRSSPAARRQPRAQDRTRLFRPLSRCWSRWCSRPRRPTVGVNKATGPLFTVAATPAAILALGEESLRGFVQDDRPLQHQGQERAGALRVAGRSPRRRGAPRDRASSKHSPASGARPPNVVSQHDLGRPRRRGRHPCVPGARTGCGSRRAPRPWQSRLVWRRLSRRVHAPRPSLDDSARSLHLRGPGSPFCAACPVSDLCPWPDKTG